MFEWIMADTTVPNLVWLFIWLIGVLGLLATVQSTERLSRSTRQWIETKEMYDDLIERFEKEEGQ